MLGVGFRAGAERYALPAEHLVEVIPRVTLREVPHAPPGIVGLFTYRGQVAPVVDLTRVLTGVPCPDRLSSRVLVVHVGRGERRRLVGLLAEGVTEVFADASTPQPGVAVPGTPFLGGILVRPEGLVQVVEPSRLLPEGLVDSLLASAAEPTVAGAEAAG